MQGRSEPCKIDELRVKERPARNGKPNLRAAREVSSVNKQEQHDEELTDKLGRKTESGELRIDESRDRCGEND